MKRIILITGLLLAGFFACAQEGQPGKWKIKMNGKTLINTSTEDEKVNTKNISSSEWKKSGYLEISYTEAEPNTWIRSFLFVDENDQQLFAVENSMKAKVSLSKLRKLFAGKKEVRIYTSIAPVNPDIKVRIRRVHLCTLKLR